MTAMLYVRNWNKWQSYRNDRGVPPWIKIHRRVLHNPNWASLTDAQKGQLVSIWILAADRDGSIPADPKMVQRLCCLEHEPDLSLLIQLEFLDAKMTPIRRQPDANVTHQRREEKNREEVGAIAPYAFIGKVIKLSEKHFASWQKAFVSLDLMSELVARDEWLAEDKSRRKNWFVSTSKYLANRNMEAKAKMNGKPAPEIYRPLSFKTVVEAPVTKPPVEEREAQVERLLRRSARGVCI